MENPSLVSHDGKITCKFPYATTTKHLDFAMKQINATSIVPKNLVIRQALQNTGIPPEIANVITDSWQNNNQKAIWIGTQKIGHICCIKEYGDPYIADVNTVLAFLDNM